MTGVLTAHLARHEQELHALARKLTAALGVEATPAAEELARELIRSYVCDRTLIDAISLIDAEGEPEHEIEPFRDSLVYSLALVIGAKMLDAAHGPATDPLDAWPDALLAVLERAYALVSG